MDDAFESDSPPEKKSRRREDLPVTKADIAEASELNEEKLPESDDQGLGALPDLVLLQVLALLPVNSLARARAVCRRWRDLALHASVWRHRGFSRLDADPSWTDVSFALLRAPCLRTLSPDLLSVPVWLMASCDAQRACVRSVMELVCSTSCAIAHLGLTVESLVMGAAWVTASLRHQRSLGRLRCVELSFLQASPPEVRAVLRELQGCDLHEIGIENCLPAPLPACAGSPGAGQRALRRLSYSSYRRAAGEDEQGVEPLLEQLLTRHAASLEYVWVRDHFPAAAPLLARCANLREVRAPAVSELEALLQCPRLTTLHLLLNQLPCTADSPTPPGVVSFFAGATGLVHLHVVMPAVLPQPLASHYFQDVIAALQSSGKSALETLSISETPDGGLDLHPLSAALAGLPRLHTLALAVLPTAEFLESIDPRVAPSLRLLRCRSPGRAAARALLRRNPPLHLLGQDRRVGYHAHDDSLRCGLHDPSVTWVRLKAKK